MDRRGSPARSEHACFFVGTSVQVKAYQAADLEAWGSWLAAER